MRNYSTDDEGLPSEPIGAPPDVTLHSGDNQEVPLPPNIAEINERIEAIDKESKRLRKIGESVKHWKTVVAKQTRERDIWQDRINESKAMLEMREGEQANASNLLARLKTTRQALSRQKLAAIIVELGKESLSDEIRAALKLLLS